MEKEADISLRPREPVGVSVMRVCDALLQSAIHRVKHPGRNSEEDIHAIRTIIKRVRANLRLLRPIIGNAAFQRENTHLKEAAQLFASMREATVGAQTLQGLAATARRGKKRNDATLVHARYSRQIAHTHATASGEIMGRMIQALEATRQRLRKLPITTDDRQAIEAGLKAVYRACRRRMRRAFADGDDTSFHCWRIRVKNLYYELQFLRPVWPKRLKPMIARLKTLQELIGNDHDLAVLKTALQETPKRFGGGPVVKRVVRRLNKRSRRIRRSCRPLAGKIFEQKPRRFVQSLEAHWTEWHDSTGNPTMPLETDERPLRTGR